jgi:hypothetical protein
MVRIIQRVIWLLLLTAFLAPQARAQSAQTAPPQAPPIEPKAVDILKASCDALSMAKAMSFTAVSTYERAARNGQPLFYATKNEVTMQRPDKLRVITPGDGIPDEFYYDGKAMMGHESNAGGAWHGTAVTPEGAYHGSDYGGYYHGTAVGATGTVHTTAYGSYYHQPATVNYYGSAGCYNCGGSAWGAAAAGAAVGATVGVAAGAAASAAAAQPAHYAALPAGCIYRPLPHAYECGGGTWLSPAYGANGIYYQPVAPP